MGDFRDRLSISFKEKSQVKEQNKEQISFSIEHFDE